MGQWIMWCKICVQMPLTHTMGAQWFGAHLDVQGGDLSDMCGH